MCGYPDWSLKEVREWVDNRKTAKGGETNESEREEWWTKEDYGNHTIHEGGVSCSGVYTQKPCDSHCNKTM